MTVPLPIYNPTKLVTLAHGLQARKFHQVDSLAFLLAF